MKLLPLGTLLAVLPLALGGGKALAETSAFTSAAGITINDGSAPTLANPYPSPITVAGMTGTVYKMTVRLNGFTHTFPDDVDLLLVAPGGKQAVILADAGGDADVSGITITLDDDAASAVPDTTIITSGTYKPTNAAGSDTFPAPAPVAGANVALSTFDGIDPNGTWNLYVVDDNNFDSGSIGSWTLTITTATTAPAQAGQMAISEFRVRGPNGANDEFIEVQNATDTDHIVNSIDGSAGYAVAASNGVARFVIPNGTHIPAHGHYLGVNSVGYSLASYPAGNGTTATGNATYATDIPDNAGIALFRTAIAASFTLANRLDAVGSTSEANVLYKEGSGYPALTPFSIDYSFYRNLRSGVSTDTNNNAVDFVFVDTNGTSAGAGQRLGAPGPENLSSPVRLTSGPSLVRNLLDAGVALGSPPNRIRDFTSDPPNNSTFGTVDLRRRFTNNTGVNLTRLRFRIVDLSTFPSPSGTADLRPRTSTAVVVTTTGGNVTVQGTTLEQPPSQPNGGGFNSTLSVGTVTLATPLANGAFVDVRFLLGLQQTGTYKLAVILETLPETATGVWILDAITEGAGNTDVETNPAATIVSLQRSLPDVIVGYRCAPGVLYQLQRSYDLSSWGNIGSTFSGTGVVRSYTHAGAAGPSKQYYRLKEIP